MFIQIVKFNTEMEESELLKKVDQRKAEFEKLEDLVQKYYFKDPKTGEYGGLYIWKSKESMMKFRDSDLAKSIPAAYQINSPPDITLLDVYFPLRK